MRFEETAVPSTVLHSDLDQLELIIDETATLAILLSISALEKRQNTV